MYSAPVPGSLGTPDGFLQHIMVNFFRRVSSTKPSKLCRSVRQVSGYISWVHIWILDCVCIRVGPMAKAISLYQHICLWSLRTYTQMHISSPISISELMKYTQTPVLHSLDGVMPTTDQAMLQETIWCSKAVWDRCYSTFGEFTYGYWRMYYVIIISHHPTTTLPAI